MAVKTWTSERVTSADINTYLTNGGLVYVKQQTIGTAVSTVSVSDAFSSSFDNYLILITGGTGSGAVQTRLQLGSTTTGYYNAGAFCTYGGSLAASNLSNGASWLMSTCSSIGNFAEVFLSAPFLATRTGYRSSYISAITGDGGTVLTGFLDNTTSYTSFTVFPASGTFTGGTIRVYGYRQA